VSKHIELRVMNVFNEWRLFCGFDATKFIIDFFEDEGSMKDLRICCHLLFCRFVEKNGSLHPQTKCNFLTFLESFYNWVFFFIMCLSSFFLFMLL
jgi:hypothetical protein